MNTRYIYTLLAAVLVLALSVGCSQQRAGEAKLDTDPLEQQFDNAGMKDIDAKADNEKRVLTLEGDVQTAEQKERAGDMAKQFAANWTVANEILVKPEGEAGDRAEDRAENRDDQIKQAWDQQWDQTKDRMKDANVNFSVENGVVTLDGKVQNRQQREQVQTMAKNLPGVKQVVNKLEISGQKAKAGDSRY